MIDHRVGLIGLDVGTTSIKSVRYDPALGNIIASFNRPTPVEHPIPEWSQHDPEMLYQVACAVLREAAAGGRVQGMAVSSFAEAGLPLDASRQPLYPIIAWYDPRSQPQARKWSGWYSTLELHALTGQRSGPAFGANKWLWIRENHPEVAAHTAFWLSAADYLRYRLTGECRTDFTMASRTLLFDPRRLDWSDELLERVGLTRQHMPAVFPSSSSAGFVTRQAAKECGLPQGTPLVLGGHDHLCAALAVGGYEPGTVVDSTGTAEALVMAVPAFHTGSVFAQGGFACYPHVVGEQYILKGGLKLAGGAVEWAVRLLGENTETPAQELPYAQIEDKARQWVGRRVGPLWLPHWLGSGTPQGDILSRAAVVGLRPEHGRGDLLRGLLESLAFWMRQNLEEMSSLTGQETGRLVLLGGATRLELLSQLKADVLGREVEIPTLAEASAVGAALLAGLGLGLFANPQEAVQSIQSPMRRLSPHSDRVEWYNRLYQEAYLPLYQALAPINQAFDEIASR